LLIALLAAPPGGSPRIELLTMGWGPVLDQRYGHAALCVVYQREPQRSHCYNYGATTAGSVHELAWGFLRGTAKFELVVEMYDEMMDIFRGYDRTIWVQKLPFTTEQVHRMVRRLEDDISGKNRFYIYHHIDDNCATRLRNHVNQIAGGALRRGSKRGGGISYREIGRRGLSDRPILFSLANLFFGRRFDREATVWETMAHPDYLRREVHQRLRAKPVMVYKRRGPMPPKEGGWGIGWIVLFALLLALPVAITRRMERFKRYQRLTLWIATVPPSLLGCLIWFIAIVTAMPEMRANEALLVFWPTDFLMALFSERRQQLYARIRVGCLAVVSLLLALGVLIQPLLSVLLIPALTGLAVLRLQPDPEKKAVKKKKRKPRKRKKRK
jgi:hypothetical protein